MVLFKLEMTSKHNLALARVMIAIASVFVHLPPTVAMWQNRVGDV